MTKRKMVAQVNQSRLSKSLGPADPRLSRTLGSSLQADLKLGRSLRVDRNGRVAINPARPIAGLGEDATLRSILSLESTADLEDVIEKVNEIINDQVLAGQVVVDKVNEVISGQVAAGQMGGG